MKKKNNEEFGVFKNKKVDDNVSSKTKTFIINEINDDNLKIKKSYNTDSTIIGEDVILISDSDQNKKNNSRKRFFSINWIILYILVLVIIIFVLVYAIIKITSNTN